MNASSYGIWPLVVFNSVLFMVFTASFSLFTTKRVFNVLDPLLAPGSTPARRLSLCTMRRDDWGERESRQR